jgi:tetratricopeptide (TPR) repeat protein
LLISLSPSFLSGESVTLFYPVLYEFLLSGTITEVELMNKKIGLFAVLLILVGAPVGILADEPAKIPEFFETSFTYEGRGNYAAALNSVLRILRIDQRNYVAMLRAGWLSYLKGDYNASVDYYQKAVLLEPEAIEPGLGLMLPMMASKEWDAADAVARKILKFDEKNYLANSRLAYVLFSQGRYGEAEKQYRKIISWYPADIDMKLGLGWTYLHMGNKKKAAVIFREVLTVRKNNTSAHYGMELIENGK